MLAVDNVVFEIGYKQELDSELEVEEFKLKHQTELVKALIKVLVG